MTTITLPHKFNPRHYQLPILSALDRGATRAVAVWHRRAGKEKTFLNYSIKKSAERIGTYFYLFPTYKQAKKAIWEGRDKDGFPFLGHVPPEYLLRKNESDLRMEFVNGSALQLIGSDQIDSIMSTNPIGVVLAEYSLQDPRAWEYLRPILKENGGWAIFDYTPRGKNHGWDLYQLAKGLMDAGDPNWFAQVLTVRDTGVLSDADIESERREGMSDDMIQQEYFCSFQGVQQGSIFGLHLNKAEQEGRVCGVPWQPECGVETWWDIGTGDACSIWFTQTIGREVHVIDYAEDVGKGIDHYCGELKKMPYTFLAHHGPHDIRNRSFAANGKSAAEVAAALGVKFDVVDKLATADQITAGRTFMQRCWFDRKKTERGRAALASYHYTWDEKRKCFSSEPYHDWSSNGSDAYKQLAVGHKNMLTTRRADADSGQRRYSTESSAGWMAA